jgi:hypothetical protein
MARMCDARNRELEWGGTGGQQKRIIRFPIACIRREFVEFDVLRLAVNAHRFGHDPYIEVEAIS